MKLWPVAAEQEAQHGYETDDPAGWVGRRRRGGGMQVIVMGAGPYRDCPDRVGEES